MRVWASTYLSHNAIQAIPLGSYTLTDDPADDLEEPTNDVPDEPPDAIPGPEPEFPDADAIDGEDDASSDHQPATEGE